MKNPSHKSQLLQEILLKDTPHLMVVTEDSVTVTLPVGHAPCACTQHLANRNAAVPACLESLCNKQEPEQRKIKLKTTAAINTEELMRDSVPTAFTALMDLHKLL